MISAIYYRGIPDMPLALCHRSFLPVFRESFTGDLRLHALWKSVYSAVSRLLAGYCPAMPAWHEAMQGRDKPKGVIGVL